MAINTGFIPIVDFSGRAVVNTGISSKLGGLEFGAGYARKNLAQILSTELSVYIEAV